MFAASVTPTSQTAAASQAKPRHGFFRTLLSELNPLQYLPVVGTIYRALTGDTIPEAARLAGSLVVSGLTGGPVGVALNVGTTALEHALGLDPERLGARLLADLGIGYGAASHAPAMQEGGPDTARLDASLSWSRAQLEAYGVRRDAAGEVSRGAESGADVLNGLELARLGAGRAGVLA